MCRSVSKVATAVQVKRQVWTARIGSGSGLDRHSCHSVADKDHLPRCLDSSQLLLFLLLKRRTNELWSFIIFFFGRRILSTNPTWSVISSPPDRAKLYVSPLHSLPPPPLYKAKSTRNGPLISAWEPLTAHECRGHSLLTTCGNKCILFLLHVKTHWRVIWSLAAMFHRLVTTWGKNWKTGALFSVQPSRSLRNLRTFAVE